MNKHDIITAIFVLLGLARLTGIIEPATTIDQLLAFLSLHAVGVILITLTQKKTIPYIKLITISIVALVYIFTSSVNGIDQNSKLMMTVFLSIQTSLLMISTKLFLLIFEYNLKTSSAIRYITISTNLIMMNIYLLYPEYLYITKWWLFSGIYYIYFVQTSSNEFWVACFVISVTFVTVSMMLNRICTVKN